MLNFNFPKPLKVDSFFHLSFQGLKSLDKKQRKYFIYVNCQSLRFLSTLHFIYNLFQGFILSNTLIVFFTFALAVYYFLSWDEKV